MHPLGPAAEAGESPPDTEKSSAQQAPGLLSSDTATPNPAPSNTEAAPKGRQGQGEGPPGERRPGWRRAAWLLLGALLLLSLLMPLLRTGLWDPYELETADLARRVAVNLFGAAELAAEGADNSIPSVEDVGRGELPLMELGLSLKLFGAHTWALRLPLLLSAILGLLALYSVCLRLGGRRTAVFAVLALATSPMYFVHSRTALGDIVTMACVAWAFAALMLSAFDHALSLRWRVAALVSAGLALTAAGLCRGVLLGVGIATLAVGVVWLLFSLQRRQLAATAWPRADRLEHLTGASSLALGLGSLAWGGWALLHAEKGSYLRALGSSIQLDKQFATHDFVVHQLGHGLLPWSAFVPVALGFALRGVQANARGRGQLALRYGFVLASVFGVALHSAMAPSVGVIPFAAPFALAGVAAVALVELDKRSVGAVLLCMVSAALLVLFLGDFRNFPEKAFSAFGVAKVTFPADFKLVAKRWVQVSVAIALLGCVLVVLRQIWLTPGVSALRTWLSSRKVGAALSALAKRFARPLQALSQALDRRGALLAGALSLSGLTLSLGYYPALGAELSPVGAFESFRKLVKPGEPLAVMGSRPGAAFFAADAAEVFTSTQQASDWLLQNKEERRWLISQSKDLMALNARFRSLVGTPAHNLPVLDGRSSQALLLSNRLLPGEQSQNPIDRWLPTVAPVLKHPLDVELDNKLKVLGYEIRRKRDSRQVDKIEAGEQLVFVIAYEVKGRVTGTWQTFIHIDGDGKRFNGDHEALAGEYPFKHWQPGDIVVDQHEFELETSFTPGKYEVFFGMFTGEKRMPVTRGDHLENRIRGGLVQVVEL